MTELRTCPCGQTPTELHITDGVTYRWRYVSGNCCGEWTIEARVESCGTPVELMWKCITAWNNSPRGK